MSPAGFSELQILDFFRRELGLTRPHRLNLAGNADDAAVLPLLPDLFSLCRQRGPARLAKRPDALVLTQDGMVEGVHFRLDYFTPEQVAAKCLAVNLSDLAAMGARPLGALVYLGLPRRCARAAFLHALARGFRSSMKRYHYTIFGGDLTAARNLTLSVAMAGIIDHRLVMRRSGASPGDWLFVSGKLGLASLGVRLLEEARQGRLRRVELERYPQATKRVTDMRPRLALGQALAASRRVTACIDLSDSLARSLLHLAGQSRVGFSIALTPSLLHPEVRRYFAARSPEETAQIALAAEEDFELLFAVRAKDEAQARSLVPRRAILLGTAARRAQGVCAFAGGKRIPVRDFGFEHFPAR